MKKHALASLIIVATWNAHWTTPRTCDNTPQVDPYTGQTVKTFAHLSNCVENHTEKKTKEFKSIKDANAFKAKCPPGKCSDWFIRKK